MIPQGIDTKKYLEEHERVLSVMDSVNEGVRAEIKDREDFGEVWTDVMRSIALDYARIYALRDVMTLMLCGLPLEEALLKWMDEDGPMSLEGAIIDGVDEAYDLFAEDEEDE